MSANNLFGTKKSQVQLLPPRPQCHRNFDRITAAFFYAQKPLEIRLFSYFNI